jgi:hypothetical protein
MIAVVLVAAVAALSETVLAPIMVALITAASAVIVAAMQKVRNETKALRNENRYDHNENHSLLLEINEKIDKTRLELDGHITRVEKKVDEHIAVHAHGSRRRK